MKLILDFGNTFRKIALFKGKDIVDQSLLDEFSNSHIEKFIGDRKVSSSIISSVINYPKSLKTFLQNKYNLIELDAKTHVPVINKYIRPETLGKDRLAAIVGAYSLFPKKNVLVIDAGTCITYDILNSDNEYLGGSISPGIEMRFKSLHNFTDKLPLLELKNFAKLIGDDTETSILSGVINGVLAETSGIIKKYNEIYNDLNIILCGGDCNFFDKTLKNSIFAVPKIVLLGLNEILDFNDKTKKN